MAERIADLLIPAYCSPPTTNRTGEVRLDEMGPCLGTAGLVLMAVLASSSAALDAGDPLGRPDGVRQPLRSLPLDTVRRKIAPSLAGTVGSKSGTVAGSISHRR